MMELHGGMGGIDRIYLGLLLVNFCFIILSLEFYLEFGFHTLWVSKIVLEFLCISYCSLIKFPYFADTTERGI
jgi:hypothetical protein